MREGAPWRIRPGEKVAVRTEREIERTLDENGELNGLPFTAEMRRFRGHVFEAIGPVDKMIVEGVGFRKMRDIVLVRDVRCDGSAHSGCERRCLLLFNTRWLRPVEPSDYDDLVESDSELAKTPVTETGPERPCQGQASVLLKATQPLTPVESAVLLGKRALRAGVRRIKFLPVRLRRLSGRPTATRPVSECPRHFQGGEEVRVISAEDIALDRRGGDRGLHFHPLQWSYCGGKYKVLAPVTKIIDERTGEARTIKDTVILEGVTCQHAFCPRQCYWFWRTNWLMETEEAEDR